MFVVTIPLLNRIEQVHTNWGMFHQLWAVCIQLLVILLLLLSRKEQVISILKADEQISGRLHLLVLMQSCSWSVHSWHASCV